MNDASPYNVNGTAYNGVSYTTGVSGQAARFDGVDDYIEIPAHSSRSFYTNLFSVAFWFRTTEQDYGYMLDSRTNGPERGYSLIIHAAHPGVVWAAQNDLQWYPGTFVGSKNNSYQDGNWHLAVGLRESNSVAIFLDGTLVERGTIPTNLNVGEAFPIVLGTRFSSPESNAYYTGDMDELRIYNRVLSTSEIQQLYLLGQPPSPIPLLGFGSTLWNTNGFNLMLQGSIGSNYEIYASTDLFNWVPLTNFVITNPPVYFSDRAATNFNQRFYRAVIP